MLKLSGIGTYLEEILFYLINNHDNEYLLIGNKEKLEAYLINSNVTCLYTDIQPFSIKELFTFPLKKINKYDLFFTPNFNIPGGIKIPVFSVIHDVVFLDVKWLVSLPGVIIRRIYILRALSLSRVVFTVSAFTKMRILKHFNTKRNIIVTYNGIKNSLNLYSKNNKEASLLNFPYIIYVGNIKRHKGLKTLLNAYAEARKMDFDKKLVIVGRKENFHSKDKEVAKALENNPDIIYTGEVPDLQLYNLIKYADCLVQPSEYEGFGIPPLEALYLGTNVIISDIPVFNEVYKHLPVTYFKVGNKDDLKEKLFNLPSYKIEVCDLINLMYNYENSAKIISCETNMIKFRLKHE